jgi:hypothetical protein
MIERERGRALEAVGTQTVIHLKIERRICKIDESMTRRLPVKERYISICLQITIPHVPPSEAGNRDKSGGKLT